MTRHAPTAPKSAPQRNPYSLGDQVAYEDWRRAKLDHYPATIDDLMVEITDLGQPTDAEIEAVLVRCNKANAAIYRANSDAARDDIISLGKRLGLYRLDANLSADADQLTAIEVLEDRSGNDYIPHTDRPLNWHTDGYYNLSDQRIRAMTLHCMRPAERGGANRFVDPEMIYIQLRDQDPGHIAALMAPNAMTIPANIENGHEIRPARTGPVFSVDTETGALHMRYTARTRSIEWHNDPATDAAVRALTEILASDWPRTFEYRLSAGEGILCNNVLHRREGFQNSISGPGRLMLRGRYYDRIDCPPREKE